MFCPADWSNRCKGRTVVTTCAIPNNIKKNNEERKTKSSQANKGFSKDVKRKKYPNKKHYIKMEKKELKKYKDYLNK